MNITIIGAGGVGGYFGGILAKAGNNVTFIARGQHLDAIKRHGLRVKHHAGDFTVQVSATDNPVQATPSDLVLFTVKGYDTQSAVPVLKALVGKNTNVLTLQNGVESYQILGDAVGRARVLPGAAYIESRIDSPGVIQQTGPNCRIVFGEADGSRTPRAQSIHKAFLDAGIKCEISDDVMKVLWTKFVFIAPVAGLTTACRTRMLHLLDQPDYRDALVSAMREVEAVARAHNVRLDPDVVDKTMAYVTNAVKDLTASMHLDLDRGRRLELETLTGAVVRLGEAKGVPTPINKLLYLILKPHMNGKSGRT
ncbi:MAG: 2-dehydropantoate 2-reductase [SAR202 cluster bacterium]|nr:2-dehydropantoate 2-reductase [SAR202 cluster bacterium]